MRSLSVGVCPLCNGQSNNTSDVPTKVWIDCPICGDYGLTESAVLSLYNSRETSALYHLCSYTREQTIRRSVANSPNLPKPLLTDNSFGYSVPNSVSMQEIYDQFPKTVSERLDKTILNIGRLSPFPGSAVVLSIDDFPVAYSENRAAFMFCLEQLKLANFVDLDIPASYVGPHPGLKVVLIAQGWNRFAELERGNASLKPHQAFVAMAFAPEMQPAFDSGLRVGIKAAGYDARRIDGVEHNNKIDDEIIAEIRKSRFLVADFTLQRGGIYFEAGFALGLGMPVIWTIRKDDLENVHFDTRQYNHIDWQTPEELARRLQHRIEATIGRSV